MRSESEMNREDIIRMAREAGWQYADGDDGYNPLWRFAALVAAAKQEQLARQWDALHEQYMADPLRRHMMLSYEMVANAIRGQT